MLRGTQAHRLQGRVVVATYTSAAATTTPYVLEQDRRSSVISPSFVVVAGLTAAHSYSASFLAIIQRERLALDRLYREALS